MTIFAKCHWCILVLLSRSKISERWVFDTFISGDDLPLEKACTASWRWKMVFLQNTKLYKFSDDDLMIVLKEELEIALSAMRKLHAPQACADFVFSRWTVLEWTHSAQRRLTASTSKAADQKKADLPLQQIVGPKIHLIGWMKFLKFPHFCGPIFFPGSICLGSRRH